MIRLASHPSLLLRVAIIALLVMASLCRGEWGAPLAQHAATPLVGVQEYIESHGHYHAPVFDHFHDESLDLSEAEHQLMHLVSLLDQPAYVGLPLGHVVRAAPSTYVKLAEHPLPPFYAHLYRPPRLASLS